MQSYTLFTSRITEMPTFKFAKKVDDFLQTLLDKFKTNTAYGSFAAEVLRIQQMNFQFKKLLKVEEEGRPNYKFDYKLYREKTFIENKIENNQQNFEQRQKEHEESLRSIRQQLDEIHEGLVELQSSGTLAQTKRLVLQTQIHFDIEEDIDELAQEMDNLNCCQRWFESCRPQQVKNTKSRLEKLKQRRDSLASDDEAKKLQILITGLEAKRGKLQEQLHILSLSPPQNEDKELRHSLYRINGLINDNASVHFHALTFPVMIRIASIYYSIRELHQNWDRFQMPNLPEVQQPLMSIKNEVLDMFNLFYEDVKNKLKKFYCPEFQFVNARQCYNIFSELSLDERNALLSGHYAQDLLDKFKLSPIDSQSLSLVR